MLAWISNTIPRPRAKRAAAIAFVNAWGNIGSIPGSYIWPAKYGPYYTISFGASLAILSFAIFAAFMLRTYLKHLNKKLDRDEAVAFETSDADIKRAAELANESVEDVIERRKTFRYLY
jgi:hypothetical protein